MAGGGLGRIKKLFKLLLSLMKQQCKLTEGHFLASWHERSVGHLNFYSISTFYVFFFIIIVIAKVTVCDFSLLSLIFFFGP